VALSPHALMQIDARLRLFLYIVGVFLTCLLIGNLIGGKLTGVWVLDEERLISVGQLSFPLTFVLTDIVNEFYGRRAARTITMLGFFMTALAFGIIHLADAVPFSSRSAITPAAFENVFTSATRIQIASMIAYLVAQFVDIFSFFFIKKATGNRFLWLRATGSTVISQLIDTVLVVTIAFPGLPSNILVNIIITSYAVKLFAAVVMTPVIYAIHELLERKYGLKPVPLEERGD
jgi:uncharacterized integral membrane protein (TIGR00697 family)